MTTRADTTTITYLDALGKTTKQTTLRQLMAAVQRLKDLSREMRRRFLERSAAIDAGIYALMVRAHVHYYGKASTGKTALAEVFVRRAFSGAKGYARQMNQYLGLEDLLGPYDTREIQEGRLIHRCQNTIGDSHLVMLDEFSRGHWAALETLFGIFNERRYPNGEQVIEVPLISAFVTSNKTPERLLEDVPDSAPQFLDRFAFHQELLPVRQAHNEQLIMMYDQDGVYDEPYPEITIQDLEIISGFIKKNNGVRRAGLIEAVNTLCQQVSDALGRSCTMRLKKVALNVVQSAALLDGKLQADFIHMSALASLLCRQESEMEVFLESLRTVAVNDWQEVEEAGRTEREFEIVDGYKHRFDSLRGRVSDGRSRRDDVERVDVADFMNEGLATLVTIAQFQLELATVITTTKMNEVSVREMLVQCELLGGEYGQQIGVNYDRVLEMQRGIEQKKAKASASGNDATVGVRVS